MSLRMRVLWVLKETLRRVIIGVRMLLGRLLLLSPIRTRFGGAYPSREAAIAAAPSGIPIGYNNDSVVEVSYLAMCRVMPWDYPLLYWLSVLSASDCRVLDAGGHMGTKYRAFGPFLNMDRIEWTVYDVPVIVEAGRRRASSEGLHGLRFVDSLAGQAAPDILIASGLLQYLDISLGELLNQLQSRPGYILLNKVALREGRSIVTLENFGSALVPYQIHAREPFLRMLTDLGYSIVDQWEIPSLAHTIPTHPELGSSQSGGFCLRRN